MKLSFSGKVKAFLGEESPSIRLSRLVQGHSVGTSHRTIAHLQPRHAPTRVAFARCRSFGESEQALRLAVAHGTQVDKRMQCKAQ